MRGLIGADDDYDNGKSKGRLPTGFGKLLLLGFVVVWQLWTLNELTSYESALRDGLEKHTATSEALAESQLRLAQLRGNSTECMSRQRGALASQPSCH